jgi:hypothetical protein
LSYEDVQEIVKRARAGETSPSLSAAFDVTRRRINQIRVEYDIPGPGPGQPKVEKRWTKKERRSIERECAKRRKLKEELKEYTLEAIGKRYGCSPGVVNHIMSGNYFSWSMEEGRRPPGPRK